MKFKKTPIFFLFCLITGQTLAQKSEVSAPTPLSSYRSATIRLPGIKDSGKDFGKVHGFFNHFEVIDDRLDTARIGVHTERSGVIGSRTRQMVFERPAAAEISDYLNARYSNHRSSATALLVIRALWLSDASYNHDDVMKDPELRLDRTKIRLRVEVYAGKDSVYVPLFRYDSLFLSRKESYKQYSRDLADLLDDLGDSAALAAGKKLASGRKLKIEDIYRYNQSRSDAAISKNAPLLKGVYKDFSEFRNNNPSISGYEIKKEKDNMLLYLKEAGDHSYYTHNAWGYCDGTSIFVMHDGVLIPAWKEGKAWYLLVKVTAEDPHSYSATPFYGPPTTAPVPGQTGSTISPMYLSPDFPRNYTQMHVFTVDMDTGAVY